ncbi:16S rRNA (uracil(1498)-N(3))-methyltransferase [Methylopila henanensis]|uniref:Ribosomal RNA small subunit methyltransferase E n=1 Tax=Methylopila henanensis TaxID=873516 RepID=A0ABW4K7U2_9HYPH
MSARYDFTSTRLFVEADLAAGASVDLGDAQANYLRNVLRFAPGDGLLLFNGRDGEWRARTEEVAKKRVTVVVEEMTRPQTPPTGVDYLFAPLKHARLDYMVQKAVEMGVGRLRPVLTRRTQAARVNLERMRANVVEAAEQCGVISAPEVLEPEPLEKALEAWPAEVPLAFCDEAADVADPMAALRGRASGALGVLIGPEGGFDPAERAALLRLPSVVRLSLGPRILRADTAAVAALALVQAARDGDASF